MYQTELYHHGIKGQKWGIRRYQNPDGTLTEEGRRRYGHLVDSEGRVTEEGRKKTYMKMRTNSDGTLNSLGDRQYRQYKEKEYENAAKRVQKYARKFGDPKVTEKGRSFIKEKEYLSSMTVRDYWTEVAMLSDKVIKDPLSYLLGNPYRLYIATQTPKQMRNYRVEEYDKRQNKTRK